MIDENSNFAKVLRYAKEEVVSKADYAAMQARIIAKIDEGIAAIENFRASHAAIETLEIK